MRPARPRLAAALLAAALVSACGQSEYVFVQEVDEGLIPWRAGLNVGQATGCSTTVVAGLTAQLIEEVNCIAPNLMVDFSGTHTTLYAGVNPFLHLSASNALKAATVQKNDTITISSAYRSLAQQYLLYKWWQAGQCNIQLAAAPGTSNHQSGRAIDTPHYSYWNSALSANGWTWLGSSDVVHFDYLAAPNVATNSILAFQKLWNKNNASKLAEDGVWGPATETAMANSPVSGFANHGCVATGKLVGAIYQAGDLANRVSGAQVTVNGTSVTTGPDGLYEFVLPPGTYTATVQKAGYSSNSVTRPITAGGTIWGSMEINPVATTGTLRGLVYEGTRSTPLAGATVAAGGKTVTTTADGAFTFTLGEGDHTLTVTLAGYQSASSTQTVTAGAETVADVALTRATGDAPPVVTISSPAAGLSSPLATVGFAGTATDDGPLGSVKVSLNDVELPAVALSAGAFAVDVKLRPGANTVVVQAVDSAGQSSSASWTGSFRAGASGVVRRYDLADAKVASAQVVLLDAATGAEVASDLTDAAGSFDLELTAVPGSFALTVKAAGFLTQTRTLALTDERREQLDVALTPGTDGVYTLRFIEPKPNEVIDAAETNVSGVVSGFQLAGVTVNGTDATLVGDSAFVARMPLREGTNVFEVVASSSEGHSVSGTLEVTRPMSPAVGTSCASAPAGGLLLPLLLFGLWWPKKGTGYFSACFRQR